jgi:hypothetical protein
MHQVNLKNPMIDFSEVDQESSQHSPFVNHQNPVSFRRNTV